VFPSLLGAGKYRFWKGSVAADSVRVEALDGCPLASASARKMANTISLSGERLLDEFRSWSGGNVARAVWLAKIFGSAWLSLPRQKTNKLSQRRPKKRTQSPDSPQSQSVRAVQPNILPIHSSTF